MAYNSYPMTAVCAICGNTWGKHSNDDCPGGKTKFALPGVTSAVPEVWVCYSITSSGELCTRGTGTTALSTLTEAVSFYKQHGQHTFVWAEPRVLWHDAIKRMGYATVNHDSIHYRLQELGRCPPNATAPKRPPPIPGGFQCAGNQVQAPETAQQVGITMSTPGPKGGKPRTTIVQEWVEQVDKDELQRRAWEATLAACKGVR